MTGLKSKIVSLVEPLCKSKEIILRDVSLAGREQNINIKIIVDTESGITLSECQELSKDISDLFYQKDMIKGRYNLEVSSPGLERPLQDLFEYRRNIGRDLKVIYNRDNDSAVIIGELIEVSATAVRLRTKSEEIEIPLSEINSAIIQLKW